MSAIDVESEFENLWRLLGKIKYPLQQPTDSDELPKDAFRVKLLKGCTTCLLPIIHHTLLIYGKRFGDYLVNIKDYKIYGQSDTRFTDEVYRMLRNEFNYNPTLQSSQFLTLEGYAKPKLQLVSQIIKKVMTKESQLRKDAHKKEAAKKSWNDTNLSKKINKTIADHKEEQQQKKLNESKRKEREIASKQARIASIKLKNLKTKYSKSLSNSNSNNNSSDNSRSNSHTSSRSELSTNNGERSQNDQGNNKSDENVEGGDGTSFCQVRNDPPVPIGNSGDIIVNVMGSNNNKNDNVLSVSPRLNTTIIENEEKASELSDSDLFESLTTRIGKKIDNNDNNNKNREENGQNDKNTKIDENSKNLEKSNQRPNEKQTESTINNNTNTGGNEKETLTIIEDVDATATHPTKDQMDPKPIDINKDNNNNDDEPDSPRLIGIRPSQNKYNEMLLQSGLDDFGSNDNNRNNLFTASTTDFGNIGNIMNNNNIDNDDGMLIGGINDLGEYGSYSNRRGRDGFNGTEAKVDLDFDDDLTIYGKKLNTGPTRGGFGNGFRSNIDGIGIGTNTNGGYDGIFSNNNNHGSVGNIITNNNNDNIFELGGHTTSLNVTPPPKKLGISDTYITSETTQVMFATILSRIDNFETMFKDYAERTDARLTIMEGKIEYLENRNTIDETKQSGSKIRMMEVSEHKEESVGLLSNGISGISGITGITRSKNIKGNNINNNKESTIGSPPVMNSLTPADGVNKVQKENNNNDNNYIKSNGVSGMDDGATVGSTFIGGYSSHSSDLKSRKTNGTNVLSNNVNLLNNDTNNNGFGTSVIRPPKSTFLHENDGIDELLYGGSIGQYRSFNQTQTAPLHFMKWPMTSHDNEKSGSRMDINGNNNGTDGNKEYLDNNGFTDTETQRFLESIKKTVDDANDLLSKSSDKL